MSLVLLPTLKVERYSGGQVGPGPPVCCLLISVSVNLGLRPGDGGKGNEWEEDSYTLTLSLFKGERGFNGEPLLSVKDPGCLTSRSEPHLPRLNPQIKLPLDGPE